MRNDAMENIRAIGLSFSYISIDFEIFNQVTISRGLHQGLLELKRETPCETTQRDDESQLF